MKGLNICNWTRVGEAALCGKSCCGTYCKNHLFKIRKGSKIPAPCRSCGRGVQSDMQLCRACGREKFRQRHISLEKRARDQFLLVLADLAVRNLHLESGIAGCIYHSIYRVGLRGVYHPSNMTIMDDMSADYSLDEYIEQLLAEMPEPVVNNILDEPISEAVKERPLLPRKYRPSPPPRKANEKKKKAIIKEFDPAPIFKPFRTIQDYQKEILEMFKEASKNGKLVFRKTPWAIGKFCGDGR